MIPSTAEIRQFLMEAFSDDELNAFCFDYFTDVYNGFAAGQTKGQRIHALIEYCQHHEALTNLTAHLQRARPEQYAKRFSAQEESESRLILDPKFLSSMASPAATQSSDFPLILSNICQTSNFQFWRTLERPTSKVTCIAFSPDATVLAGGLENGEIWLWQVMDGLVLNKFVRSTFRAWTVTSIAFAPEGNTLIEGAKDSEIRRWDKSTGEIRDSTKQHSYGVNSVAVSPDGKIVASGAGDKCVCLCPVPLPIQSREAVILEGHMGAVNSVAFSPRGGVLASASSDAKVKIWEYKVLRDLIVIDQNGAYLPAILSGKCTQTFYSHSGEVYSVAFAPDGEILMGGSRNSIWRWLIKDGTALDPIDALGSAARSVAFSPPGDLFAAGCDDKTVKLWQTSDWQVRQVLPEHQPSANGVSFSYDGKLLAFCSDNGTVHLWKRDGTR